MASNFKDRVFWSMIGSNITYARLLASQSFDTVEERRIHIHQLISMIETIINSETLQDGESMRHEIYRLSCLLTKAVENRKCPVQKFPCQIIKREDLGRRPDPEGQESNNKN